MTSLSERENGFYGGMCTAMRCVTLFDQPVIIDEIMGTLNNEGIREIIQWSKENDDFDASGIAQWIEDNPDKYQEAIMGG